MTTNPSGTELPNKPGGSDRFGTTQPDPGTGSGSGFGPVTVGDVLNAGTDPSTLEGTTSSGQDGVEPDGEVIPEKTIVVVEGGGGVGCVAKPIFDDGALLHIRVVHGGFGYRFPPNVRIIDPNQKGAGATAVSYIGKQTVTSTQPINFDKESDVEDYDFTLPPLGFDPSDVPFGQSYSLSSNTVIGDWDPRKVLSVTEISGFAQELQKYLDFLKGI